MRKVYALFAALFALVPNLSFALQEGDLDFRCHLKAHENEDKDDVECLVRGRIAFDGETVGDMASVFVRCNDGFDLSDRRAGVASEEGTIFVRGREKEDSFTLGLLRFGGPGECDAVARIDEEGEQTNFHGRCQFEDEDIEN